MTNLTDEQKINICKTFIKQSPPGQLREILRDLSVIAKNEELVVKKCSDTINELLEEQLTAIQLPGKASNAIISKHLRRDGHYFDPDTGAVYSFDFLTQEVTNSSMEEVDQTSFQSSLFTSLKAYVSEHSPNGSCSVIALSDKELVVVISNQKFQPNNFWSGNWRSVYIVKILESTASLQGWVHSTVHYFEDGNVQVNAHKDVDIPDVTLFLSSKYENTQEKNSVISLQEKLVAVITRTETDFQLSVNDRYSQLGDTTFRALRRSLPITKTRIDWSKIYAYKLGSELSRSSQSQ